jgi:hypothetical protein
VSILGVDDGRMMRMPQYFLLGSLILWVGPLVFFLPTIIAFVRGVDGKGSVFLVNILALLTMGICWFLAVYMAFRLPQLRPRPRGVR